MGQRFQVSLRAGQDGRRWLAMLVAAMEEAAPPAKRRDACDSQTLAALRTRLALPAQPRFTSPFSLRN